MSESAPHRLLIVDDEEPLMKALCNTLETEGYVTTGFTSAKCALAQLADQQFDLLLTDLMMPEMDGISLLRAAREIDRDVAALVMTGHGTIDTAVKALQAGALDYILKPFRLDNLLPVLTRALATRRLQMDNIRLREAVSIYELARAITTGLEHDEVLQRTLEAAIQQNDAGAVCIMVPSEDGRWVRVSGTRGTSGRFAEGASLALDSKLLSWVSRTREELAGWDGSSQLQAVLEPPFPGEPAAVGLPIVAGEHFYGILTFSPLVPQRRLSSGQIKALHILASSAASALEGASLLAQLRKANQELEQRVEDRTRELQASNADLEAFSYSVSHDLRAPLHAIDGFCQIFLTDFGTEVPPAGRALLEKVCAGVTRMHRLIDDLLHLARFSRQPLESQRVSMSDLALRVAANLQAQARERSVQLQIAELPECDGDRSLLEQVLTNLLSNAFKFTGGCQQARIEVGAFLKDGEQVYFVKDNGAGFDMEHADKLFGVFQRLHSQREFAGTGIGLSIVHRIIRRHDGRTWAEGRPQGGATFYFSLPASPKRVAA